MDVKNGNGQLLTSWKEIAAHLGKGVRTVQRWERLLGLPVKRPAENRHIVMARAEELDDWIAQPTSSSSTACCSCSEELASARHAIVNLREQIATLESELSTAMLAVQVNGNVSQMSAASSGRSSGDPIESDGNAA